MLMTGTACYRDVLDRLSQRLAFLLEEVDKYSQQHHRDGEGDAACENTNFGQTVRVTGDDPHDFSHPNPLLSWPSLRIRYRVDALRAWLNGRRELQEKMQRVDASMQRLLKEHLIDMSRVTASHPRRDRYGEYGQFVSPTLADVAQQESGENGAAAEQEAAIRRVVWLYQQLLRHKDEFRELRKRASTTYEHLRPQFDKIASECGRIFRATAQDDGGCSENTKGNNSDDSGAGHVDDPVELHALCRRNEERARRLQSRLQRTLSVYRQIVARTNLELCRVELEVQAMERQSPHAEELTFVHHRGGAFAVQTPDNSLT
ncbi:actin-like protein, putative [Trypanosoma cruzi marinkellei]|uniref:Actin-like protein, putative n=1 Tax=Trypanosoma cruzi marinkellei TaxID=85056 RepID=K2M7X3_TRYCR|nr:actin-like protein, putative [Trypanosoma cruzi marinkellei]